MDGRLQAAWIDMEAGIPELRIGRGIVMQWLIPNLANRLNVPCDAVRAAMHTLPRNYCVLLDSAEGVSAISAAAALVLGVEEDLPFKPGLH